MKSRLGMAIIPLVDILLVLLALLMLLVAVPQRTEVALQGQLPEIAGAEPPAGLEVYMDGAGNLTGGAAAWVLPPAGQSAILYCQEADIWRLPVIRLRADGQAPHRAVMTLLSFFRACEVAEVAVLGLEAPAGAH